MSFYAVKVGCQPGIYTTWAATQAQVSGYSGAIFKKFPTQIEAEAFVKGATRISSSSTPTLSSGPELKLPPDVPMLPGVAVLSASTSKPAGSVNPTTAPPSMYHIWTDGSSELKQNAGYGWAIVKYTVPRGVTLTAPALEGGTIVKQGGGKVAEGEMSSPQAELYGAIEALRMLYELVSSSRPLPNFIMYCDASFVVNTINDWGPKRKDWTGYAYATEFQDLLRFIDQWRLQAKATIVKVKAHSGIPMNEYVDVLADKYRRGLL